MKADVNPRKDCARGGIVISHKVDPKDVTEEGFVPDFGIWMRHDMLHEEFLAINLLNLFLAGTVVVMENASGAYVVRWFVRVKDSQHARIAVSRLAEIVSDITGIDLMRWESKTRAGAVNALCA